MHISIWAFRQSQSLSFVKRFSLSLPPSLPLHGSYAYIWHIPNLTQPDELHKINENKQQPNKKKNRCRICHNDAISSIITIRTEEGTIWSVTYAMNIFISNIISIDIFQMLTYCQNIRIHNISHVCLYIYMILIHRMLGVVWDIYGMLSFPIMK